MAESNTPHTGGTTSEGTPPTEEVTLEEVEELQRRLNNIKRVSHLEKGASADEAYEERPPTEQAVDTAGGPEGEANQPNENGDDELKETVIVDQGSGNEDGAEDDDGETNSQSSRSSAELNDEDKPVDKVKLDEIDNLTVVSSSSSGESNNGGDKDKRGKKRNKTKRKKKEREQVVKDTTKSHEGRINDSDSDGQEYTEENLGVKRTPLFETISDIRKRTGSVLSQLNDGTELEYKDSHEKLSSFRENQYHEGQDSGSVRFDLVDKAGFEWVGKHMPAGQQAVYRGRDVTSDPEHTYRTGTKTYTARPTMEWLKESGLIRDDSAYERYMDTVDQIFKGEPSTSPLESDGETEIAQYTQSLKKGGSRVLSPSPTFTGSGDRPHRPGQGPQERAGQSPQPVRHEREARLTPRNSDGEVVELYKLQTPGIPSGAGRRFGLAGEVIHRGIDRQTKPKPSSGGGLSSEDLDYLSGIGPSNFNEERLLNGIRSIVDETMAAEMRSLHQHMESSRCDLLERLSSMEHQMGRMVSLTEELGSRIDSVGNSISVVVGNTSHMATDISKLIDIRDAIEHLNENTKMIGSALSVLKDGSLMSVSKEGIHDMVSRSKMANILSDTRDQSFSSHSFMKPEDQAKDEELRNKIEMLKEGIINGQMLMRKAESEGKRDMVMKIKAKGMRLEKELEKLEDELREIPEKYKRKADELTVASGGRSYRRQEKFSTLKLYDTEYAARSLSTLHNASTGRSFQNPSTRSTSHRSEPTSSEGGFGSIV